MTAVKRRLELLKLEGLGFSKPEIVKELSQKHECSGRTVYRDFESRDEWQPELLNVGNHAHWLKLASISFAKWTKCKFFVNASKHQKPHLLT